MLNVEDSKKNLISLGNETAHGKVQNQYFFSKMNVDFKSDIFHFEWNFGQPWSFLKALQYRFSLLDSSLFNTLMDLSIINDIILLYLSCFSKF